MVVIPNVDHQVILVGLLVALDDPSKLLAHPIPVKEQLETSDKAYMPYFVGDVPWRHPSIRHVRGSGQQSAGRSRNPWGERDGRTRASFAHVDVFERGRTGGSEPTNALRSAGILCAPRREFPHIQLHSNHHHPFFVAMSFPQPVPPSWKVRKKI